MNVYGIQTTLTSESEEQLRHFFRQCPFELQLPMFLELGVSLSPDIELVPDAEYSMIPLHFEPAHNHRTGNGAMFWMPAFFEEATKIRMDAMPYVLRDGRMRGSIVLANGVYALNRKMRAYLNSLEESQHAAIGAQVPLTLEFEGEVMVEYAVDGL